MNALFAPSAPQPVFPERSERPPVPPEYKRLGLAIRTTLEQMLDESGSFGIDLAEQRGDLAKLAAYRGIVDRLRGAQKELDGLNRGVLSPKVVVHLPSIDRLISAVSTLLAMHKALGNRAYEFTSFEQQLPRFCPPDHAEYWRTHAGEARGLLDDTHLKERLAEHGVLAWSKQVLNVLPGHDQIVVLLTKPAWCDGDELISWVFDDEPHRPLGDHCQACGVSGPENQHFVHVIRREIVGVGRSEQISRERVHPQCAAAWTQQVAKAGQLAGRRVAVLSRDEE